MMKKTSLVFIALISLLFTGCISNKPISFNQKNPDTTQSRSKATDVYENPDYTAQSPEEIRDVSENPNESLQTQPDTADFSNNPIEFSQTQSDTAVISDNPSGSSQTQQYTAFVSDNPIDTNSVWYSIYAQYISAYITFENGGRPAEIIYTPFIESCWTATYSDDYSFEGFIMFALYDINSSGSTELIIGHKHGNEQSGYFINIFDVYTVDSGSISRIIACRPNDAHYTINSRSIEYAEGNIIGTITEYTLSPNGCLVEEHFISFDYEDRENILQETGKSLNDTPAELDWKRLFEYYSI